MSDTSNFSHVKFAPILPWNLSTCCCFAGRQETLLRILIVVMQVDCYNVSFLHRHAQKTNDLERCCEFCCGVPEYVSIFSFHGVLYSTVEICLHPMAEWLRAWDTLATRKLWRRKVVSSIPDRGTIVGWVFSPTRQLVRFSHMNVPFFLKSELIWNIVLVGKQ